MNKAKVLLGGVVAALLLATGFSGVGWADAETVVTFGLVESLSAASATLTDTFNKGSVVYVRVKMDTEGTSSDTTVRDDTYSTPYNEVTFTVYDDGTFPDNKANDGYYWGRFTIRDGDPSFTDDDNDILGLTHGETATITCNAVTHGIIADYSPPDHESPQVSNFETNPNPFSPNGDNVQDTTTISYSLSDNISTQVTVRVEIRDGDDKIIKTLVDAETQDTAMVYSYSWDGTNDEGNPVSDGNYVCRILALDGSGNSVERTLEVTIDTLPPVISGVSVSPTPFSPNDDAVKDTTTISFFLSGAVASQNRVKIRNSSGVLVKTLDDEISPPGGADGSNSVTWNGKDETGTIVPDGSYFYEIWAVDDVENMSSFTGEIVVDTTFPTTVIQVLDNSKTHTSPFDLSDLGATPPTGLYISDVEINGEWQTSDPSGIYEVKVYINGDLFTPQNPNGNWQGWYLYWTPPASNDTYTILVRAVDNVGNDSGASGATTTIIYDNQPPVAQIASPHDGIKFNTSTLMVSGTATDGAEGCGVKEVQIQVTNLSTSGVVVSFAISEVSDTSSEGDWSTWEYVFTLPDPGSPAVSYLIECRAVDNLYDPLSPTSSSHIQLSPDSITVIYDTRTLPYHPTDLKDDGVPLSTGHIFGTSNLLTCNQIYFPGLEEVRFEYRVEPSGDWQIIGSDSYPSPATSYTATVSWNTTGLSTDVTYSFRALAISGTTVESEIPSETFSECRIDNTAPSSPTNFKDDGTLITSGHAFGSTNLLSADAEVEDSSLWGVRFEYRDYTTLGPWTTIGTDTSPEGSEFSLSWNTSTLDTTHIYWVRAVAVDVASNETSSAAITGCSIDYDPPVFQSLSADKDIYQNGDTITITANLDESGYSISCDFSSLDSEYDQEGNVESVVDNLDSTYTISYTIHSLNTRPDSSYTVVVVAEDYAGNRATSSVTLVLNNTSPSGPVKSISKVSLDYEGEAIYDLTTSTQPTSPSVFASSPIDTAYLKVNLNKGVVLDKEATSVSLNKVIKIYTGYIETEPVEGSSLIKYDDVVELYFYIASPFNPQVDGHTKDGFYQVKAAIVDEAENTQELDFFFVYDTMPPEPPQFELKSFDSTTGVLTLSGTTPPESSEPQWIQAFVNNSLKATTQTTTDRSFSIQLQLPGGENSIALRAQDRAGNIGEFTPSLKLICNPERLLVITFRSSRVLRESSKTSPVKLIYYLSEPAEVNIRIYNFLGEIVYDWQEEVNPGGEEEWSWWGENMFGQKVNNGVYIMTITAVSSNRKETVTKLVGILR